MFEEKPPCLELDSTIVKWTCNFFFSWSGKNFDEYCLFCHHLLLTYPLPCSVKNPPGLEKFLLWYSLYVSNSARDILSYLQQG